MWASEPPAHIKNCKSNRHQIGAFVLPLGTWRPLGECLLKAQERQTAVDVTAQTVFTKCRHHTNSAKSVLLEFMSLVTNTWPEPKCGEMVQYLHQISGHIDTVPDLTLGQPGPDGMASCPDAFDSAFIPTYTMNKQQKQLSESAAKMRDSTVVYVEKLRSVGLSRRASYMYCCKDPQREDDAPGRANG